MPNIPPIVAVSGAENPTWSLPPCDAPANLSDIAQKAIDVYLLSKQSNGEIGGIGWWQSANGYTAMALHDVWAKSKKNYAVLAEALRECERRKPGLVNEFNDDTLWWGVCCLHVYSIGHDEWFLNKAKHIHDHIHRSNSICRRGQIRFQGTDMEGACYWTTNIGEEQLNSITTGLFAELSVRLALLEDECSPGLPSRSIDLIETARCSLGWILRCRYRSQDCIVLDNILITKQQARDWTFTYTTGVAIGVCALLYEATEDSEYITLACSMARQAMCRADWVDADGVLTERGAYGKHNHKPWQNSDAVGFKAILLRHLGTLYATIYRTKAEDVEVMQTALLIKQFININLRSQQERNTNGNGQYGPWWNGPFEMSTSHSQMAVLDVMAAAVLANSIILGNY